MDCTMRPVSTQRKCPGYKKTYTGCWTCRSRKIKCDEARPHCTPCLKGRKICPGYEQKLVWVLGDQRTYRHNGRRFLSPEETWKNRTVLSSSSVDSLIDACDSATFSHETRPEVFQSPFWVFRQQEEEVVFDELDNVSQLYPVDTFDSLDEFPVTYTTFESVFAQLPPGHCSLPEASSLSRNLVTFNHIPADISSLSILKTPRAENRLVEKNSFLLNYYIHHVAPLLVPVHSSQNPWARYPGVALYKSFNDGQNHLLHALMSLAAVRIGNISGAESDMSAVGMNLYSCAMSELRSSLTDDTADCLYPLMTIMTFLLIELFQGNSKTWRYHLSAAWKLLRRHRSSPTLTKSGDGWYIVQSFHLLRVKFETSLSSTHENPFLDDATYNLDDATSLELLFDTPLFGWTLGASPSVIECISEINKHCQFSSQMESFTHAASTSLKLSRMLMEDDNVQQWSTDTEVLQEGRTLSSLFNDAESRRLHLRAFKAAVIIYYHQTFYEAVPGKLAIYASQVFDCIEAFVDISGGNYTLWPLFIAGVEVYMDVHKSKFMTLFESASKVGMGNRVKVKALIERIWEIRACTAIETGRKEEEIHVNWKRVKQDMGIDVLLV